MAIMT